jgi:hypothetical protein
MVVCGSGPSLDANLDGLCELSRTHWITACGSNFRTLKANGIRVDFLALMERSDDTYDDMKSVVETYGAGETRLICSTTCHHQLHDLFVDSMVFFRPALTPLALFSNSPAEVLNFEGPESINTGVALAAALGLSQLVLVGVDLGSRTQQKLRSEQAIGTSLRTLDLEYEANFGGKAYTSSALRDARMAVEACIRHFSLVEVLNASDGVLIEGAQSKSLDDLLVMCSPIPQMLPFDQTSLGSWWNASPRYSSQRFHASWASRRPRAEIASLLNHLQILFSSNQAWSPAVIQTVTQLLALDVRLSMQFPRRVVRSTLHKLVIAVNRQLMVMASSPELASDFDLRARRILIELLESLEQELYTLCDAVESLQSQPTTGHFVASSVHHV